MRRIGRTAMALALLMALTAAIGCGAEDEATPSACREGADAYLTALREAPGAVLLEEETPISECLTENQGGGQLEAVGATMIDAATRLNQEGREDPGGDANLQAGYLVGAAERGAEETSGVHAELIRRLSAAALYSPGGRGLPARYLATYRQGVEVGRERG